jgi:hypothetical protein
VALGVLAVGTMLQNSARGRYRGLMDAILDIFNKFVEFGTLILPVVVLGTLFFGGIVAGMATEWAGRRWR